LAEELKYIVGVGRQAETLPPALANGLARLAIGPAHTSINLVQV